MSASSVSLLRPISHGRAGGKPAGALAGLEAGVVGGHHRFMSPPLIVALAIIAFAAGFHLHWALGGRLGYSVSLPQRPTARVMAAPDRLVAARRGRRRSRPDPARCVRPRRRPATRPAAAAGVAKAALILGRRGLHPARGRADALDRLLQDASAPRAGPATTAGSTARCSCCSASRSSPSPWATDRAG